MSDTDGAARGAGPAGVGQGAGAVGLRRPLGIVSLTGGWVGTVAFRARVADGPAAGPAVRTSAVEKGYGNAWQATAMWGGIFALVALIVAPVVVLARPAFGAPGRPQAVRQVGRLGGRRPRRSSACSWPS
ncbi:hypothetical protein SVIOM342S_00406 [Streptomyces violaceorubidus]